MTISWFGSQNQMGYGLSVVPQNRQDDKNDAGHTSGSSGLFHLEASWARVSQSSLKTSGGVARMVHVASSQRSHGDEDEDKRVDATGCIRLVEFSLY
jgi:anti-sigma factor RsiW